MESYLDMKEMKTLEDIALYVKIITWITTNLIDDVNQMEKIVGAL
jgi:hypothetical protein